MSSSTYPPGFFSVELFFQPIYTDYANFILYAYSDNNLLLRNVYLNETKLDIGMFLGCSPFKEYLKFLNRLYDITWFGAVYA
jgi:hypothetical protein